MLKTRYLALIALPAALFLAPTAYYESGGGKGCTSCHEIQPSYDKWHASTHRNVSCAACHGDALTLNPRFHLNNLHRLVTHTRERYSEPIHLSQIDLPAMLERCRNCHRQEFADWQAGPHGATYSRFFIDATHNRKRLLEDDCLRCHGMHFQGGIRDLVGPIDTKGPWKLVNRELANLPAIPCFACHEMHTHGDPLVRPVQRTATPGPKQELNRPSLALYDRREQVYFSAGILPLPGMREGDRLVKMSTDRRQTVCYQCHAPLATAQVASGDDRTAIGVHEGLSCLACHLKHGQQTRASCGTCHPRLSNCGIDVEMMDTTFKDLKSPHNIHRVKCIDCHPKGVPQKPGVRRAAS